MSEDKKGTTQEAEGEMTSIFINAGLTTCQELGRELDKV